jgi:hypothetical protein
MKNDAKDGECSMHRKYEIKFKLLVYNHEGQRKRRCFICNDETMILKWVLEGQD